MSTKRSGTWGYVALLACALVGVANGVVLTKQDQEKWKPPPQTETRPSIYAVPLVEQGEMQVSSTWSDWFNWLKTG
ncbi:hypothetical protein DIPPA_03989 [Diplonema papillatum]|nr:hypothetical protein DIPPA_03989 [Diplonema papillatum]